MDTTVYERFDGAQVTDEMLVGATRLFSENYGVWGGHVGGGPGRYPKAGESGQCPYVLVAAQILSDC